MIYNNILAETPMIVTFFDKVEGSRRPTLSKHIYEALLKCY